MARIKKVCTNCGSDQVSVDATARWNIETQDWEITDIMDGEFCDDCDCETHFKDAEIDATTGSDTTTNEGE